MRERVLAKAHELGYSGPDPVARTLSRGRTGSIGVVLDAPLTLAFSDPAAVELLHGIATVCEERELGMSLVPRIPGRDAALVQTALVDGFVVYCMAENDPRLDAIRERRLPYVLVDHGPGTAALNVDIDDRGAARATAEHLVGLGHRRFGVVLRWDGPEQTADQALAAIRYRNDRDRLLGWRDALESAGVDFDAVPLGSAPSFDRAAGRVAGGRLLDRAARPSAILCASDVMALGVIDAARDRGVHVPRELSVTGFDDIPAAAELTTVRQPHAEKGAVAARLLVDGTESADVLLPTEFLPRSSTAPHVP
jgi:DNA-binding LacI/PurR family transcriptional regulator